MACLENIHQTAKLLTVKKEALPDLKARLHEVNARYEEAAKAREQKKKADDLKKELAWSHVAAKSVEMEQALQAAAKLARRLPKIEESCNKAEVSSCYSVYCRSYTDVILRTVGEREDRRLN